MDHPGSESKPARGNKEIAMKQVATFSAIGGGVTVVALLLVWAFTGFSAFGMHGAILGAMILGIVLSGALAIGLMGLVFASGRGNHDEAAYRYELVKNPDSEM
jgi:hypothetical protein